MASLKLAGPMEDLDATVSVDLALIDSDRLAHLCGDQKQTPKTKG